MKLITLHFRDTNDILDTLRTHGAAIITGSPNSKAALMEFGRAFGEIVKHPHSDDDGLTMINFNPAVAQSASGLGFLQGELILHTDRTSDLIPPDFIITMCSQASEIGGACKLADTRSILDFIKKNHPDAHDILHSVHCVFGETLTCSPVVSTNHDHTIVRFRYDSLGFYPPTTWDAITVFRQMAEGEAQTFSLVPGQMYIADNHRVLHGRTAYVGERRMMRLHVNSDRIKRGRQPERNL
jgi:alpha-ketoglutarate-dependent taurine dioxygenase